MQRTDARYEALQSGSSLSIQVGAFAGELYHVLIEETSEYWAELANNEDIRHVFAALMHEPKK